MNIKELKKWKQAPETGQMLLYRRSKVEFEPYVSMEAVNEKLKMVDDILEIHLFNKDKEYRAVITQNLKRFPDGVIEYVSDVSTEDKLEIYVDEVCLDNSSELDTEKDTLYVINHITYDQRGMAVIDDYRLSMEKIGG